MMTDSEVMEYLDVPFKFWACPTCEKSIIDWVNSVATCRTCGKANNDKTVKQSKG